MSWNDLDYLDTQLEDIRGRGLEDSVLSIQDRDPDQFADDKKTADELGVGVEVVELDRKQAKLDERIKRLDMEGLQKNYPKLAESLSNPETAAMAIDDAETLSGINLNLDKLVAQGDYWENQRKLAGEWANDFVFNAISTGAWAGEQVSTIISKPLDVISRPFGGGSLEDYIKGGRDIVREFAAERKESAQDYYGGERRGDIQKVIDDPSMETVGEFLAEEGPQGVLWLAAAGVSLPTVTASIANSIAEERMINDDREKMVLPSDKDMYIGAATSLIAQSIEKFALGRLIRSGKPPRVTEGAKEGFLRYAGKEVPKAALTEAGTEAIQEAIEYSGGAIGTEAGWNPKEMLKSALAGALVGGPLGGGVRLGTVGPEYNAKVFAETLRASQNRIASQNQQNIFDDILSFAQESKTNQRSGQTFQDIVDNMSPDQQVYIDANAIADIEGLPQIILDQMDNSGGEIMVPMKELLSSMGQNDNLTEQLRPHLRFSEQGLSQNELATNVDRKYIKEMLDRAENNKQEYDESQEIFEQVRDQLVATGRQSEATANQSATLIPAVVATQAAEYRKQGITNSDGSPITVKQLYEDMGLTIMGPEKKTEIRSEYIPQEPEAVQLRPDQKFGDMVRSTIAKDIAGNDINVDVPMQQLWDQQSNRKSAIEALRGCLSG